MAVKLSNPRGNAGFAAPVSDINVTPLVDVMLVLLIVFMVAAPLMAQGVKVDLPKSTAKPLVEDKPPIAVSLDAHGALYVDKTPVTATTLLAAVEHAAQGDKARRVNIRGDKSLAYGKVIETMGQINEDGFTKIALVSSPIDEAQ
jgi:TolR protein